MRSGDKTYAKLSLLLALYLTSQNIKVLMTGCIISKQGKYHSSKQTLHRLMGSSGMGRDDRSKICLISKANYSSSALGRGAMP